MKYIKELALLGVFGFMVAGADDALAKNHNKAKNKATEEAHEANFEVPHAGEKPLMVIRFNEASVAYEWPLYETLTKALEVRPQAQFDVVSVAPRSTDLNQQLKDNDTSTADLTRVLATLKEVGMPENRYKVSKIYDDVKTSEVRIYIR